MRRVRKTELRRLVCMRTQVKAATAERARTPYVALCLAFAVPFPNANPRQTGKLVRSQAPAVLDSSVDQAAVIGEYPSNRAGV